MPTFYFPTLISDSDIKSELNFRDAFSGKVNETDSTIRFQNRVWTLFAKMGFTELNQGYDFQYSLDDGNVVRLFDIVAKDYETVIFAKCIDANSIDAGNVDKIIRSMTGSLLQQTYAVIKKSTTTQN